MAETSGKQILEIAERIDNELQKTRISGKYERLNTPLTLLEQMKSALEDSLSQERYAHYKETIDVLIAAISEARKGAPDAGQTLGLCIEVMSALLNDMQSDHALLDIVRKKKEIVFLPYKAAMWDSLESIWKAAYDDKEHCNTYVVPIPYADRNPDYTARDWHHEIDLFPDYVPVIDYRDIDLEAMHPDVIFIHNPYDNCNAVTSVDSMFYSDKLKRYTDNLVYVPYFVTGGKMIAKNFCHLPGVENADHVIVESENIKRVYEREYPGGNPPEGKFIALGSPKYDKIVNARKEDYPLPEEWKQLIGDRKIILYLTSIHDQLIGRKYNIEKLRGILAKFRNRDDVVLWWRPHPLIMGTFHTMMPEHYEEYKSIVEEYKREGWGIYDDTSEMDRALVWSDAYYGDHSSTVWLYEKTDKPMLNTSMDRIAHLLCFSSFIEYDSKIYFIAQQSISDVVFSYDPISRELGTTVPIVNPNRERIFCRFSGLIINDDEIMAVPFYGEDFISLNLNTKQQFILDKNDDFPTVCNGKFVQSVIYKNKAFFSTYDTVCDAYAMDMDTKKLYRIHGFKESYNDKIGTFWDASFICNCIYKHYYVCLKADSSSIAVSDADKAAYIKTIDIGDSNGYIYMTAGQNAIYFLPAAGQYITCYRLEREEKYDVGYTFTELGDEKAFDIAVATNGKLYLFGKDKDNEYIEYMSVFDEDKHTFSGLKCLDSVGKIYGISLYHDKELLISSYDRDGNGYISFLDLENLHLDMRRLSLDAEERRQMMNKLMESTGNRTVAEVKGLMDLRTFVDAVSSYNGTVIANKSQNIGESIYRLIKNHE